jgi:hyaluronan synthase
MFTTLIQVLDFFVYGHIGAYAVFYLLTLLIFLIKVIPSWFYKPYTRLNCRYSSKDTSVIIPVVDEPECLFKDVLTRIQKQGPGELIVVINGPKNESLEKICIQFSRLYNNFKWIYTPIPGKRNALVQGLKLARKPILVLVDSDTVWEDNTLQELIKPFGDRLVGGVTTKQRILNINQGIIPKFADWVENIRNTYSFKSYSVFGQIGCLPGRTIAIRKVCFDRCAKQFLEEKFLGIRLEYSDDRSLTNYILKQGYKTVYQETSQVYTTAPVTWKKYTKQQLRWARGCQYNHLRMFGWMIRKTPYLGLLSLFDTLLPFAVVGSIVGAIASILLGNNTRASIIHNTPIDRPPIYFTCVAVSIILVAFLKFLPLVIREPKQLFYLPIFTFLSLFYITPIRVIGFITMAMDGSWGTREGGYTCSSNEINPKKYLPSLIGIALIVLFSFLFFIY